MCQTELLFVIVTVCWAALNLAHNGSTAKPVLMGDDVC